MAVVVVSGADVVLAVLDSGPLWSLDFFTDAVLLADAVLDRGPLLSLDPLLVFFWPSRNGCLRPVLGEHASRAFRACTLASPWSSIMYGRLVGDLAPPDDFFFVSEDLLFCLSRYAWRAAWRSTSVMLWPFWSLTLPRLVNFSRLCCVRVVISLGNSTDLTGDFFGDAGSEISVVWVHSCAPVSPFVVTVVTVVTAGAGATLLFA